MDIESYLEPPVSVEYSLTYDCQRACAYCNLRSVVKKIYGGFKKAREKELDLATIKRIMDEARDGGAKIFFLTGGEPFIKECIYEIIEYGVSLGLFMKATTKHAFTKEEAKRLSYTGIKSVAVSFDSFEDKTNSKLHGNIEIKEELQDSIEQLMNAGLKVQIAPVLTRINYKEYERLVRRFKRMGINSISPVVIRGALFSICSARSQIDESLLLDIELKRRLGEELIKINQMYEIDWDMPGEPAIERKYPQVCSAADHAYITPDGKLTYCSLTPDLFIGSIKEKGLMDVWQCQMRKELMRPSQKKYSGTGCKDCEWFDCCNWLGRCYAACLDHPPFYRPEENRLCKRVREILKEGRIDTQSQNLLDSAPSNAFPIANYSKE